MNGTQSSERCAAASPPTMSSMFRPRRGADDLADVDRAGQVFVNRQASTLPDLRALLATRVKANAGLAVYIAGDADTPHGRMIDILDFVRSAGVQKVAFTVKAAAR